MGDMTGINSDGVIGLWGTRRLMPSENGEVTGRPATLR
jgi:hypothetical protein